MTTSYKKKPLSQIPDWLCIIRRKMAWHIVPFNAVDKWWEELRNNNSRAGLVFSISTTDFRPSDGHQK